MAPPVAWRMVEPDDHCGWQRIRIEAAFGALPVWVRGAPDDRPGGGCAFHTFGAVRESILRIFAGTHGQDVGRRRRRAR